jgi:hypothetical protein
MIIMDSYLLKRSEEFNISGREEVNINLSLDRVPVEPKTKIIGKVIDRCNNGIEGATVKIFTSNYIPVEHVTTNSCGEFVFKNIIPSGRYYVIATAPAYKVSKSYERVVRQNTTTQLIIKLERDENSCLGVLYGYVRDGVGKGIDNATVKVFSYNKPNNMEAITRTNNDGEYLVYGLRPGKYFIIAEKIGYKFTDMVSFIIEANEFTKLDLVLYVITSQSKGTISGKIVSCGIKVPYAVVSLYRIENNESRLIQIKRCNEDGVYLFGDIEPGSYVIKCNNSQQIVWCN